MEADPSRIGQLLFIWGSPIRSDRGADRLATETILQLKVNSGRSFAVTGLALHTRTALLQINRKPADMDPSN